LFIAFGFGGIFIAFNKDDSFLGELFEDCDDDV